MRRMILVVTALMAVMAGCVECEAPPEIDLEAERAALLATDQTWFEAYDASDSPADVFADKVVEDAVLLPPGAPLASGREAIREVITNLESMPGFGVTWGPSSAHVGSGGALGYTLGTYEMTMAPEGEAIKIVGKYLTVWQKQGDGSWMITADMFNADGAPTAVEE